MLRNIYYVMLMATILTLIGCSSSNPVVKPRSDGQDPITYDRMDGIAPPQNQLPSVDLLMYHLCDVSVGNYYYCNGRVPDNFTELESSGLLMGIPKCPYTDIYYHEVPAISISDPAGFVYHAVSKKAYSFSYLIKEGDDYKTVTTNRPESIWKEKLYTGTAQYSDAKVQALLRFFNWQVYLYVRNHGALPQTPEALLENYSLVKEGWKAPSGISDTAYFEYGIDLTHGKVYSKIKYTHGYRALGWQDLTSYSATDDADFEGHVGSFSFSETPPTDVLVLNPWFTFDNLEQYYNNHAH